MSLLVTIGYGPDSGVTPPSSASTPVITVVSPVAGATLSKFTSVVLTVADTSRLRRIFTYAFYAGMDVWEVVHDGVVFSPKYRGSVNDRTVLSDGFRYTLLRDGGWPGSPSIKLYAVNVQGNGAGV